MGLFDKKSAAESVKELCVQVMLKKPTALSREIVDEAKRLVADHRKKINIISIENQIKSNNVQLAVNLSAVIVLLVVMPIGMINGFSIFDALNILFLLCNSFIAYRRIAVIKKLKVKLAKEFLN
jgi:hypothetical protein